jgi:hypothetical protein
MRQLRARGLRIVALAIAGGAAATLPAPVAQANPFVAPAPLTDAESGGGGLGQSVAISAEGTVAVVGEPNYNHGAGAALVYANSHGTWAFVQRLTPSGESGAGHFGAAVAVDGLGQTIVVGAPKDAGGVGAAWAFALSNGTWSQQGKLLGGAGETGAGEFGASVAVATGGAVALVGAPMSDAGEGQVFTFYYEAVWYLQQHMPRTGVSGAAHFGASVAIDANASAALVGAPNAGSGNGAIYPYTYFGLESPYWIEQPAITSPAAGSRFGASVTMSRGGEYDVAGAPLANGGEGAAYVYRPNGMQQAVLADPARSAGGNFGASVAVASYFTLNQLVVGAPGENSGAGAAYAFDTSGGTDWSTPGVALTPERTLAAGDAYGASVAVAEDGSSAINGSPGTSAADGAATIFLAATTPPGPPVSVQAVAGVESATLGWSAPEATGGAPISGYTATSTPGGFTCHTSAELSCTVVGLTAGQSYAFTVTATNSAGTSLASAPSNAITPEAAPSGDAGSGGPPVPGGNGGSNGAPVAGAASGLAGPASQLAPGGSGGGSVRSLARDLAGQAATPSAPLGPLSVTRRTTTSITLSWSAGQHATGVAGFRIDEYVRGSWRSIGVSPPGRRLFVRRGLRHGTRHRFEVRAYDPAGHLSAPLIGSWCATR